MRISAAFVVLFGGVCGWGPIHAASIGTELAAKREALSSLHQEFEVGRVNIVRNDSQASKRQIILDRAGRQWREEIKSGSGDSIKFFDGMDLFSMDGGGTEYVRTRLKPKNSDPLPDLYGDVDWPRAKQVQQTTWGIDSAVDRPCVVVEVPVRQRGGNARLVGGEARVALDTETGAIVSADFSSVYQSGSQTYQSEIKYRLQRISYGIPADAALFRLPSEGMSEVKELSRWTAAKIKKQLAGSPAPELSVTDIQGAPLELAAFKGKTVLLDFWTTWCPPCLADAPVLDKLYAKYGGRELVIVGISVSEDRSLVERFLKEHPHKFPVVLTTENDMPRPYEVTAFPTYIVIDQDGKVESAVEGNQGIGALRSLLKKAGMEVQ